LGAAELALGRTDLGLRSYSRPLLVVPGDERRVPLSEIALFRPFDGPAGAQGLSTRFRPYLFLKGWYDRPRWDYFDAGGHVDYVFNRYGLRDHDFELQRAPGEFRAVAIGDSFTFGVGVQLQDCWTEVAETALEQRLACPVEVINAGFASGYHADGYEEWILRDGVRLEPDVVLIGLCLNDLHPGVSLYAWQPPQRVPQWLGGRSRLANAVQEALLGPLLPRVPQDWDALVRSEPAPWQACQDALRRLHAHLGARGIRLVVVPLPMVSGLREDPYPYQPLLDRVAAFCDAEGIERTDLAPRVRGLVDEDLWVHPTDQHPNHVGQRLLGEGVAEYLAQSR
ncbi:MAG: hypothetical protein FJ296_05190, partial [Planctomycetes bacterium]|nr:hypothetical protein [Planctomycetota bacterium]